MRILCAEPGSRMTDMFVASALIVLFVVWKRNSVLLVMKVGRYDQFMGYVPIMKRR